MGEGSWWETRGGSVWLYACTDAFQRQFSASGDKDVLFLVQAGHLSLEGKCMACFW